ncbi:type I restriction-modification system subunit M N-terminal domain-containing protein [Bacteroides fragilis]
MAIKKTQLYSILWESCNILRGSMDASQYKNYVLTMLFLKYISDKVQSDSDIFFDLPEGCFFNDIVALKGKPNIGEEIQKKLHVIARANPRLDHIINEADFDDSTKLGTGKAKVDTLTSLISVFQRDFLDFSKNRAGDDDLIGDAYEYLMKNFAAESGKRKVSSILLLRFLA